MTSSYKGQRALTGTTVEARIHVIRGQRVMLDADLAALYGVSTAALNQAVRRNRLRFPDDFLLEVKPEEVANLISQIVISSRAHGGRRKALLAFTEQGVAMLSSVLRGPRAVGVNVEIMRAFVRLRRLHGEHAELVRRLDELEARYDERFRVVFDAIRALMRPAAATPRPIGFREGGPRRPQARRSKV